MVGRLTLGNKRRNCTIQVFELFFRKPDAGAGFGKESSVFLLCSGCFVKSLYEAAIADETAAIANMLCFFPTGADKRLVT